MPVRLFVVKPVEERERGLRHPVVDAIRARARAPAGRRVADPAAAPLADGPPRPFAPALRRVAPPRPLGLARAAATALARRCATAGTPFSGPRKIYVKELLQAVALADRLLAAPDVRHLHAHFAHGTTTITWHAARIAGLPFSFTGHARDIYARAAEPEGLAAAQAARRALRRHLHGGQPPPSRGDRARGRRSTSSTTASTPTSPACCAKAAPPTAPRPARCACSPSAGWSPRRASTCSSRPAPSCAAAGVPFEAAIVGQDDKHGAAVRQRIARLGLEDRDRGCRARWARRSCCRVPPRERSVHAVPPARRRPRRHPERARRGDGGGHAGRGQRRLGHPRAGRARASTACSSPPERPGGAGGGALRLHGDPALCERARRRRRARPSRGASTATASPAGSPGCSGRRSHGRPPSARARCSA